jgi:hypothetical protein
MNEGGVEGFRSLRANRISEAQGDEHTRHMIKRYRPTVTTCRGHMETV